MSVFRLLKTRAGAADAAAAAAAGVDGPSHVHLTSGTACVFEHERLFSALFVQLFITVDCQLIGYGNACKEDDA